MRIPPCVTANVMPVPTLPLFSHFHWLVRCWYCFFLILISWVRHARPLGRLAKHLVSLYFEVPAQPANGNVDHGLLRDYIAYSRRFVHPEVRAFCAPHCSRRCVRSPVRSSPRECNPPWEDYWSFLGARGMLLTMWCGGARGGVQVSDDAERELIEGYLRMRRIGSSAKTITATPRQLESLIRLSEVGPRASEAQHFLIAEAQHFLIACAVCARFAVAIREA